MTKSLIVREWRKRESRDTSERCILYFVRTKRCCIFPVGLWEEPDHNLLADATMIHALETMMRAMTCKRGLFGKRSFWAVTQQDMTYLAQ